MIGMRLLLSLRLIWLLWDARLVTRPACGVVLLVEITLTIAWLTKIMLHNLGRPREDVCNVNSRFSSVAVLTEHKAPKRE